MEAVAQVVPLTESLNASWRILVYVSCIFAWLPLRCSSFLLTLRVCALLESAVCGIRVWLWTSEGTAGLHPAAPMGEFFRTFSPIWPRSSCVSAARSICSISMGGGIQCESIMLLVLWPTARSRWARDAHLFRAVQEGVCVHVTTVY